MKKRKTKRLTIAQKKVLELEERLATGTEGYEKLLGMYKDTKSKLEEATQTIANAKRILTVVPGHNDIAPDHMYLNRNNRGEMLNDSDNLISLAICAITKVSEYRGKERKEKEVQKAATLATVNLSEERKQIIRVAVEQPQKYTVVTNQETGLVEVYSREQGSRNIL